MLLFNFLFVFYLMVLVNSHTISKSIAEYNFDDESDSLFDTDNTRGRKNRHDVFLHKYRREEKDAATEPNGEKKTITEIATPKPTTKTLEAREKTKAHHKFWRKFKMKNDKDKYGRIKRYKHKRITINPRYPNRITAHKDYRLSHDAKRKREASVIVNAKLNKNLTKDKKSETSTTEESTFDKPNTKSTLPTTTYEKTLSDITTKLTSMKLKYGMDKYSFLPKLNKVFYEYRPYSETTTASSKSTMEETEFPGTAQIEELLNDIKARAIQMIADQSPAITEILTNAATEATFEADPIVTHVAITSPGFALTTFVSLSNIDEINKRTNNEINMVVISDKDSHNMSVRSCKNDAFTIAQNVEDSLQEQLKKIYKKVKSKVSKDYQKELKTVQSTLADEKKKVVDKIGKKLDEVIKSTKPPSKNSKPKCPKPKCPEPKPPEPKCPEPKPPEPKCPEPKCPEPKCPEPKCPEPKCPEPKCPEPKCPEPKCPEPKCPEPKCPEPKCPEPKCPEPKSHTRKSTKTRQARAGKVTKKMKTTTTQQETTPSIDDFAMLTLYEQILAKTHEDNVMKMLTTSAYMNLDSRLSKRNATPDVTDANTLYDEIIVNSPGMDNQPPSSEIPSIKPDYNETGSTDSVEDTSYEGLVDKISFNDYVNGYKHYLNFQKSQAEANFSNLIKFQAHKHHKVDDIGKFILNKIPQLPTRKRRYFFDDSDIEYQDVSTKSDDSWFKKHFYMFIDNGPPKKYHTSETVNFKDVTGGNSQKVGFVSRSFENSIELGATEPGHAVTEEYGVDQENINLDDLSKVLEDRKFQIFPAANQILKQNPMETSDEEKLEEGGLAIKIYAPHVISKWFGNKQNRKLRKSTNIKGDDTFLDSDRLKRDANIPNLVNVTSSLEVRSTTYVASHTARPKAINNKKDGCVSIDVVSEPTSIVKLRSNTKQSKFKKLLKKLHIIRNKKKQKRQAKSRRFNPFKKLKDIVFKNNELDKPMDISRGYNNDYDILNSHIDTFKPVKYNIPNMDDLKNQIPNITNDFGLPYAEHLTTPGMVSNKDKVVDIEYEKYMTPSLEEKHETKPYTFGTHNPVHPLTKETPKTFATKRQTTTVKRIPSLDDIMSINIKSTSNNISEMDKSVKPNSGHHLMSLQDIKSEIEKLNQRIYSHGTPNNPHSIETQPQRTAPSNGIVTFNRKLMKHKPQRIHKKPNKIFFGKKPIVTQDNIEIKSVSDFPKLYKFDDYNLQEINGEISDRTVKSIIVDNAKLLSTTELADINTNKPGDMKVHRFKDYRDDFNELLLWHGDILSYDALTSSSWQDILDGLHDNQYTTPNLLAMQDELAEMQNILSNFKEINIVVPPKKDSMKNKTSESKATTLLNTIANKASNFSMVKRDEFDDGELQTTTEVTENVENKPIQYYSTKDYVKRNKATSRTRKDIFEPIVMDTTVLSYDDSVNFITEIPRKMLSRSSLKPCKKKNKSQVKTKTNRQPEQSFSTPFPMTMGQFELFLKQNDLDVASVTSPIQEAPQFIDNHNKPNTNGTFKQLNENTDSKDTVKESTSDIEEDLNPEDQIEYLNQELDYLESDLNYKNDDSVKAKHRKYSNDGATKRLATEKRSDLKDKEVEITIINFDDANKIFKDLNTLKSKFQEAKTKTTPAVSKLYLTHKMKPTHKIIKINEGAQRKLHKTTKSEEDPTGLHVYGHSFHYNFLFGPHKDLKGRLIGAKNKKQSTHSEDDNNGDNRDRRLNEKEKVQRFGREASSSKKSNMITALPVAISSATVQAAATANEMWAKFMPILRSRLYLFSNDSKIKHSKKGERNSTSKGKGNTNTKAITRTTMTKATTALENSKIYDDEALDKYNNIKEITSPLPSDVSVLEHDRMMATPPHEQKSTAKSSKGKEDMYVEEAPPDDMIYYEMSLKKHHSNVKPHKSVTHKSSTYKTTKRFYSLLEEVKDLKSKYKRNAAEETFTAKDVAAIEVVVDLLKNSFNGVTKTLNNYVCKKDKTTTTNSIQVHIAIPYDLDDKRRSADTQRIRKVFSAKMATPVDLEYQIHSIEVRNPTPGDEDVALSPGMYLVVDNNTGSYSLKPVKYNKQSRDVQSQVNKSNISGKVTLSKDFLATINEQLLRLYENLTANINNHKIVSRNIHWEKIRKYFGHDRVCDCKCKANKTMCRACIASDEVVQELTIAFESLSKYMQDHCTEIQTFFWMNPTGGKKLRDLVTRIDGSLSDYYKRVKGKCQGRPCKTFSTYLDKRGVNKSQDELTTFLDCIKELSQNIEMVLNNIPYDDRLKDAGEKFVEVTNDCAKSIDKRRLQLKKNEARRNEYSLDNINVNIICDPNARKSTAYKFDSNYLAAINCDNIFKDKKKKILRKLFSETTNKPRNKLFTYYITDDNPKMDKRETLINQIESPLIADTGGSFWHDYIYKNNDLNTIFQSEIKKDNTKATTKATTKTTKATTKATKHTKSFKDKLIDMYPSKLFPSPTPEPTPEEEKVLEVTPIPMYQVTTEDMLVTQMESLSYNIEELMKIFEKVYQFEHFKKEKHNHTESTTHRKTTGHKRTKAKKTKKIHRTSTTKMHKKTKHIKHKEHTKKSKATKKAYKTNVTPKNEEIPITVTQELDRSLTMAIISQLESPKPPEPTPKCEKPPEEPPPKPKCEKPPEEPPPKPKCEKPPEEPPPKPKCEKPPPKPKCKPPVKPNITVNVTVESSTESKKTCCPKNTYKKAKNNILNKLKQATAGLFDEILHKLTTMAPKHNREADILMTEMHKGGKTQVTVFTKVNNDKITQTPNENYQEKGEDHNHLLFTQQTNENDKENGKFTDTLFENSMELNEIYTDTTSALTGLIYKIEDGQQHVISQETTTKSPSILIVTTPDEDNNKYKGLLKCILDFDSKSKRQEADDTMMDIEDIMMTYTANLRPTTTNRKKEKKITTAKPNKKHANKQANKPIKEEKKKIYKYKNKPDKTDILVDTEYDLIDALKSLELPTPTGMKDERSGVGGFSIKVVPDTKNMKKVDTK